jgi:capsular exopolysaccharide synthesis family protein
MLEVDIKKPETPNSAIGEANSEAIISTHLGKLKSTSVAELLVTEMKLDEDPEFFYEPGIVSQIMSGVRGIFTTEDAPNSSKLAEFENKNRLIKTVLERITVRPIHKSNLIMVSFDAKDPFQAKTLLDQFLNLCVTYQLDQKRNELKYTLIGLESELQKSETKLFDSETELVQFVSKSGLVPSSDGGFGPVMDQLKKQMEAVLKTRELRGKYQALDEKSSNKNDELPGDLPNNEYVKKMQEQLATLEVEDRRMGALYSEAFPKRITLQRQISDLRRKIDHAQKEAVSAALNAIKKEEVISTEYLDGIKSEAMRVNALSSQSALLMRKVNMNREVHSNLLKQYLETQIRINSNLNDIHVIDAGSLNTGSIWPPKMLFLSVGLFASLLIGILAAFVREYTDDSIQTTKRIETQFDLRELGKIPDFERMHSSENGSLSGVFPVHSEPQSFMSNAFRNIQTSISFIAEDSDMKTWVLSSAIPQEGKSFVSMSLAFTYALDKSKKVLLIDADLRGPSLSRMLHETNEHGLSTLLQSPDMPFDDVVHHHTASNLFYMLAGPLSDDPVSLLGSDRLREVCNILRKEFDVIIFDSSPILAFPDTRILSRVTDGLILLARQGHVTEHEVISAIETILSTQKTKILGVILNRVSTFDRAYNYYDAYYSSKNNGKNGSAVRRRQHERLSS